MALFGLDSATTAARTATRVVLVGALGDGPPKFTGLTSAARLGTQLKRAFAPPCRRD